MSLAVALTSPAENLLALEAKKFFDGKNEGGMGRWTYVLQQYWANLIAENSDYYLHDADLLLMANFTDMLADTLSDCRVVCEIGPGAERTIVPKTVPIARALRDRGCLEEFATLDSDIDAARASAQLIHARTGIPVRAHADDFFKGLDTRFVMHPKAFLLLGGTIGNLPGGLGTDCRPAINDVFNRVANNLQPGDFFAFTFDQQTRQELIERAYNGRSNEEFCISFLHLIKRDCNVGAIKGKEADILDPLVWRHKAVWNPRTQQVAHIIFPRRDQHFTIDGQPVSIKGGTEFVMNNSYKFTPEFISGALQKAGLSPHIHTHNGNPMALAIATKLAT